MSWLDDLFIKTGNSIANVFGLPQAEARKDIVAKTEAEGRAKALEKGYTFESGLFGKTERAGSPQSGLEQNQAVNFLDILKWNSQNAPSSFQESGKDKSTVLVVNTPEGYSKTVSSPSGSTTEQQAGKDKISTGEGFDWVTIILIVGAVFIALALIKKG